jgi:glycosyl-4,4'-diaponeurosporenoate acyltransferase
MQLWVLPTAWTVAVNIGAWFVLHMVVAYGGTLLPISLFRTDNWLFRTRRWEHEGRFYDAAFRVRSWKGRLPDGAGLFRQGFRKKSLSRADPRYIETFARETCRAELVHWLVLASSLLFFIWNSPGVGAIMILYAVLANGPCIIAQRYNRPVLCRIADGRRRSRRG